MIVFHSVVPVGWSSCLLRLAIFYLYIILKFGVTLPGLNLIGILTYIFDHEEAFILDLYCNNFL